MTNKHKEFFEKLADLMDEYEVCIDPRLRGLDFDFDDTTYSLNEGYVCKKHIKSLCQD